MPDFNTIEYHVYIYNGYKKKFPKQRNYQILKAYVQQMHIICKNPTQLHIFQIPVC